MSTKQKKARLSVCLSVAALITACQAPNLNSNTVSQVKDALASSAPNLTQSATANSSVTPASPSATLANGFSLKIDGKPIVFKERTILIGTTGAELLGTSSERHSFTIETQISDSGAPRVGVFGHLNKDRSQVLSTTKMEVMFNPTGSSDDKLYSRSISGEDGIDVQQQSLRVENNSRMVGKFKGKLFKQLNGNTVSADFELEINLTNATCEQLTKAYGSAAITPDVCKNYRSTKFYSDPNLL